MCIFSVDRTLEPGFALEKSKTDPVECDERMNVLCITQTSIFPEKMLLFLGLTSRRNCGVFSGQCRGLTSDVNSQSSNRRLNEEDVHAPTQLEEKHHTQRELDFWNSVVFSCSNSRS
jgi:hypothetical protein